MARFRLDIELTQRTTLADLADALEWSANRLRRIPQPDVSESADEAFGLAVVPIEWRHIKGEMLVRRDEE